jgi:outer membrane protein OmpA-like peptidoglycan-associated protein
MRIPQGKNPSWLGIVAALVGTLWLGCAGSRVMVQPVLDEFSRYAKEVPSLDPGPETLQILEMGTQKRDQAAQLYEAGEKKESYPIALMAVADARVALAAAQAEKSERRADTCRREVENARGKWQEAIYSLEQTENVVSRVAPIPRQVPGTDEVMLTLPPTMLDRPAPPVAPADALIRQWQEWVRIAEQQQVSVADLQGTFDRHVQAASAKGIKEEPRMQHLHIAARTLQEVEARIRRENADRVCVQATTRASQIGEATDAARAAALDLERGLQDNLRRQLEQMRSEAKSRQQEMYEALTSLEGKFARIRQDARGTIVSLADILFDFDKATLKRDVEFSLVRVATILNQFPEMQIAVEGHTDNVGTEAYNLDLSKRRAKAVFDFLVAQGVEASRMTSEGFGMSRPVAENTSEEGRQRNRRVDLVIREN